MEVGHELKVEAAVELGRLNPEDISVEIYHGIVDSEGNVLNGAVMPMSYKPDSDNGDSQTAIFEGAISCAMSGQHGFAVRILPKHEDMIEPYEPGMIVWESSRN